jgi:sulfite exporter TauE/SafE
MLSSIHPLGERARHNRWALTATAFAVGSIATAAGVGGLLGGVGSAIAGSPSQPTLTILGGAVLAAGLLDLAGVRAPGPHRQVNERWIGVYRGWVYGVGFGAQLGAGLATYVVTWGVWVMFAAEAMSGSAAAGAVIGLAFGAGRVVPVLAGRWIDRPSRLTSFSTTMRRLAAPAYRALAAATIIAGIAGIASGVV